MSDQPVVLQPERIEQLARSYADTIGARAFEQQGGRFNYNVAAAELVRLINQVLGEAQNAQVSTE